MDFLPSSFCSRSRRIACRTTASPLALVLQSAVGGRSGKFACGWLGSPTHTPNTPPPPTHPPPAPPPSPFRRVSRLVLLTVEVGARPPPSFPSWLLPLVPCWRFCRLSASCATHLLGSLRHRSGSRTVRSQPSGVRHLLYRPSDRGRAIAPILFGIWVMRWDHTQP